MGGRANGNAYRHARTCRSSWRLSAQHDRDLVVRRVQQHRAVVRHDTAPLCRLQRPRQGLEHVLPRHTRIGECTSCMRARARRTCVASKSAPNGTEYRPSAPRAPSFTIWRCSSATSRSICRGRAGGGAQRVNSCPACGRPRSHAHSGRRGGHSSNRGAAQRLPAAPKQVCSGAMKPWLTSPAESGARGTRQKAGAEVPLARDAAPSPGATTTSMATARYSDMRFHGTR